MKKVLVAMAFAVALLIPASAFAWSAPNHIPTLTVLSRNGTDMAVKHQSGCDADFDFGNNPGYGLWGYYTYGFRIYSPSNSYVYSNWHYFSPSEGNCSSTWQITGKPFAGTLPCNTQVDIAVWATDLNQHTNVGTELRNQNTGHC